MEFINKILDLLFGWMPTLEWTVEMSVVTPVDKLKAFAIMLVASFVLWRYVIWPTLLAVRAIVWSLVCALSLIGLSIYAAYRNKRLRQLHWHRLPIVILSRWVDFLCDGWHTTTITHSDYVWSGPFSWTLRAQAFKCKNPPERKHAVCSVDDEDDFDLPDSSFQNRLNHDKDSGK